MDVCLIIAVIIFISEEQYCIKKLPRQRKIVQLSLTVNVLIITVQYLSTGENMMCSNL